jgi:hypothetical protein
MSAGGDDDLAARLDLDGADRTRLCKNPAACLPNDTDAGSFALGARLSRRTIGL